MKSTLKNLKIRDTAKREAAREDEPGCKRFAVDMPTRYGGTVVLCSFDYKPHAEAFLAGVRLLHKIADWPTLGRDEYQKIREQARKILQNTNPPK